MSLTKCIENLSKRIPLNPDPIIQITNIKSIIGKDNIYEIIISDGLHSMKSLYVKEGELECGVYDLVVLSEFYYEYQDLVVQKIIVSDGSVGKVIGDPVSVELMGGVEEEKGNRKGGTKVLVSISGLSPYEQNWMIRGRVSYKGEIKTISSESKDLRILRIDIVDETGEISAFLYDADADFWYPKIEELEPYYFSGGIIKVQKKPYSSIPNDKSITLKKDSKIDVCPEEDVQQVPYCRFYFSNIEQILLLPEYTYTDFVGVVRNSSEIEKVGARGVLKKEVFMADNTDREIQLTLWGKDSKRNIPDGSLVVIKNVKVREYRGNKNLSWDNDSRCEIMDINNIYVPQAKIVWEWFTGYGGNDFQLQNVSKMASIESTRSTNISMKEEWKTIEEARESNTGRDDTEYFWLTGCINYIEYKDKENNDKYYYKSCPGEGCRKGLTAENNGLYFCPKCQKQYDIFEPRYLLKVTLVDSTGSIFANLFDEAETLLGKKCSDIYNSVKTGEYKPGTIFDKIKFKRFNFKIKATPPYGERSRMVQYTINLISEPRYPTLNSRLIRSIEANIDQ